MKLKELVHVCNYRATRETTEISVNMYSHERIVALFTLKGDNLEYGCINERFLNAEVTSVFATGENKFSVIIQPD